MAKKNVETGTEIGPGTRVRGRISGQEDLSIAGRVEGSVDIAGQVAIAPGGVVKAEVRARVVHIAGVVVGDVYASERIELAATARVLGDLRAPRMAAVEGARFSGLVEVGDVERALAVRPERRAESAPRLLTLPTKPRASEEDGLRPAVNAEINTPLFTTHTDPRTRRVVVKRR